MKKSGKMLSLVTALSFAVDTVFQNFAFFVTVTLIRIFLILTSTILMGILTLAPVWPWMRQIVKQAWERKALDDIIKNITPHSIHKIIMQGERAPWQMILAITICCILLFLINQFLSLGYNKIELNFYDRKENSLADLFSQARLTLPSAVASIIYASVTLVASVFFLIPGFIFGVTFGFYQLVMVDENRGIIDSFKRASELTKGIRWSLLAFHLTSTVIYALLAEYFFPVLFFIGPCLSLVPPFAYKKLKEQEIEQKK